MISVLYGGDARHHTGDSTYGGRHMLEALAKVARFYRDREGPPALPLKVNAQRELMGNLYALAVVDALGQSLTRVNTGILDDEAAITMAEIISRHLNVAYADLTK